MLSLSLDCSPLKGLQVHKLALILVALVWVTLSVSPKIATAEIIDNKTAASLHGYYAHRNHKDAYERHGSNIDEPDDSAEFDMFHNARRRNSPRGMTQGPACGGVSIGNVYTERTDVGSHRVPNQLMVVVGDVVATGKDCQ
jgi:hypothetical protein